jgi:hypothetical protein
VLLDAWETQIIFAISTCAHCRDLQRLSEEEGDTKAALRKAGDISPWEHAPGHQNKKTYNTKVV